MSIPNTVRQSIIISIILAISESKRDIFDTTDISSMLMGDSVRGYLIKQYYKIAEDILKEMVEKKLITPLVDNAYSLR